MVVSSGFMDHVLAYDRSEVYLRANGLIPAAAQPINNTLNRQQQNQQQPQQPPSTQQSINSSIMQPSANVKSNNNGQSPARVILICHSNSHPFQKRNILLEPRQEIKVGRSVPRSRVEDSNAIFDCKVLSRNHAIIWYTDGIFFIKDTGSSNGTFINSQRIKSNEAYEISSGDVVQFGVDVIENSRKETHGCIIAVLKLITPDGIEKTSYQNPINPNSGSFDNDIFRLKQIMHESYLREILLEEKLVNLQKEVLATWKNSSNTWQAMIHEDLLLSRIDILENKLSCYQKNITNEKLQEQINRLQDEKEVYQKTAKEALKKVYQERLAVMRKFTKFEQFWQASEDELMLLRAQLADSKDNDEKLQEMNNSNSESIREQMARQEAECKAIKAEFEEAKRETEELKSQLQIIDDFNEDDLLSVENRIGGDRNRNTPVWNKQKEIMKWLNNSDLKQLKDSDEIINAMCNDTKNKEFLKIDPHQCLKVYEKLLDIEKKFTSATTITTTTTTTTNKSTKITTDSTASLDNKHSIASDTMIINNCEEIATKSADDSNHNTENGESKVINEIETKESNANDVVVVNEENQNSLETNDDSQVNAVRDLIVELKDMYNEFLLQIKLVQKDLIRSAKYDELESKFISTMLELQSLQKEQKRRDLLQMIQKEEMAQADVPLRKVISSSGGSTNQTDEIRLNNNRDTLHFDNDANDDDTTVADDIILMKTDADNGSTLNNTNTLVRDNSSSKITPQNSVTDFDDGFDSMSTADETNNSSTNSIITQINNGSIACDDFSEQSISDSVNDDLFETQTVNGQNEDNNQELEREMMGHRIQQLEDAPSVIDSNLDDDYVDEKEALESFDRIIEEESKLINETDILKEEELVELKERCVKLTDDNVALRREVETLRLSTNKQFTVLMYTASLAAFIGYLFSIFFS
ncbi:sarcolemmal membrane-associated protein [Contarinia nasturtii]|uniref:sarcolemmal membrane-associated protein n=1 Tax=Contarinia nasturtii TaxID=265458 RepID=UPI0012D3B9F1|nr:sarcolemmal membrane-associated protein [Contarinia nasturtii]XP_031640153.1 sarcolemmal membrane-associated protein [Contarinia nasturtii]XP_031640154.1 sarcolemmal membrane-associated protein [Contarinia nasturtii]XP_031640155.1 sarcolemmal membrane-associated protein [Contarinia nasturtii]XP_031640156.1 sarcolemmal membrane-associated protein [Contarinia nasturtii]